MSECDKCGEQDLGCMGKTGLTFKAGIFAKLWFEAQWNRKPA